MGIQAQPLLGNTDNTRRRISFIKGLRTPLPCCLQSLVISEGHHKRGTLMQLNPKMRKFMGKGQHSQPERTFSFRNKRSVLGLPCPAFTGQRNLEFPTGYTGILHLADCLQLPHGATELPLPRSRGSFPAAPSPLCHHPPLPSAHGEPGEEPGAAQVGWGGSTPRGRVHEKGEAAALEDSALQDREFSLREQLASDQGFQIKNRKKKKSRNNRKKKNPTRWASSQLQEHVKGQGINCSFYTWR